MSVFNERLKELRLKSGLNQIELAERLGCNRQKIADMERGKTAPNVEVLIKLSKIFKTSTDYLLGVSDVISTNVDIRKVCDYTGLSEKAIKRLFNEWVREDGVQRVAKYEDEPEIIQSIKNDMISKNLLFEIAYNIFEIQDLCDITIRYVNSISDIDKQADKLIECKQCIDAILFRLSRYIVDISNELCSDELEKLKETEKVIQSKLLGRNSNSDSGSDCSDKQTGGD